MSDVIPAESQGFHRMANYGMRKLNFMPGLPPVANAEFIEDRERRPIKVLCLGMPRTGTMSLGLALATLGYKCYNHIEACAYPERDMKSWNEALDSKYFGGEGKKYGRNEFARILKGFDVSVLSHLSRNIGVLDESLQLEPYMLVTTGRGALAC